MTVVAPIAYRAERVVKLFSSRRIGATVALVASLAVAASSAHAQEPPAEDPDAPKPTTPSDPADAPVAEVVPPPSPTAPGDGTERLFGTSLDRKGAPWHLGLEAGGAYESNARFATAGGEGDESARLRASLDRLFSWTRTRLTFRAEGSGRLYRQFSDLDTFGYDMEGRVAFDPGPGVSLGLDQSYRGDLSQGLRGLADQGLLLEQVFTKTYTGRAHGSWRAAQGVTPRFEISFVDYSFDSPTLVGGAQLSARLIFDIVKNGMSWNAGYEFQRQANEGSTDPGGVAHSPFVTFTPKLIGGLQCQVTLGFSNVRPIAASSSTTTPSGGLSLGYKARRHALSAGLQRTVALAYGLGVTTVSDSISAGDTFAWSPRLSVSLRGSGVQSDDPLNQGSVFRSFGGSASASFRISPRYSLSPVYSFYRYIQGTAVPLNSHNLSVTVTHDRTWR
ncbi:MAG TPA: hypothetical protein VMV21_04015 [Vicinamibacteria bacterium]|nr:hypothetical protein [Vicinamibacteria bacterium]